MATPNENIRNFFDIAASEAAHLVKVYDRVRFPQGTTVTARILDLALGRATYRRVDLLDLSFRLKPGEGRQARAQLLAAAVRILGAPSSSMSPGESVAEWIASGFHRLRIDQVVPLLLAAGSEEIDPEELERRAR